MAKIPYGFDLASLESQGDDPWTKLYTIKEHLEDGKPIPPYLAHWLGTAIIDSKRDPKELLRQLGLERSRGRQSSDPDAWFVWGKMVCELEDRGKAPEAALAEVLDHPDLKDKGNRTTLQGWRDTYRKADDEAHRKADD